MNDLRVRIVNKSGNELPSYATSGSAGMDIRAFLSEDIIIEPFMRVVIPTGIYIELPLGFEAQLRPRSGLANKHGITLPNAPATIDSDYRGEIKVGLINLSNEPFKIRNGERIAQMIIASYKNVLWHPVETLTESERGEGGFGSTGLQ